MRDELMKLVPENYKVMVLPAFFNYTDAERIKTILSDQGYEFILVNILYNILTILIENPKEIDVCTHCQSLWLS